MSGGYISIADNADAEKLKDVAPGSYFRKNVKFGVEPSIPNESSFYFRLSGLNLYYTADDKDMVVLGAIKLDNLNTIKDPDTSYLGYCFGVSDNEADQWVLCTSEAQDELDWICALNTSLGLSCEIQPSQPDQEKLEEEIET